jgi:hypothetical protein
MRKQWTIFPATMLLIASFLSAEVSDELRIAGERLNTRLKQDAKGCAKGPALSVLFGQWPSFVSEVCKVQKNLAHLVKQTPMEELPEVLVNTFIDELDSRPPREQYPPMEDYLVIFGEPAVAQVIARYEEVPENREKNILRARFAYPNRRYSPLIVRCQPFRHFGRHPLLDRIKNTLTLTGVDEWIRQPSPGWLSYLYLRKRRQEMGGLSFEAGKLDFRLVISVHDDDNDFLLGKVSDRFQSGAARLIDLPVTGSNDAPYRISLAPRLQKDIISNNRWVIKIPLFNIDKPIGCAFPLTVPIGSSAAGRTQEPSGRKKKWQVRHIGPPPEN